MPEYVVSDHRALLAANLFDSTGVVSARCYFRVSSSSPYWFVPMARTTNDNYRCEIPALAHGAARLEYQFVIANNRLQVIRSQVFSIDIRNDVNAPSWQRFQTNNQSIFVHQEHGIVPGDPLIFSDANVLIDTIVDTRKLLGLRTDIYSVDHIDSAQEFMQGYFGGFAVEASGSVVPVQGFAMELNPQKSLNSIQSKVDLIEGSDWEGEFYVTNSSSKNSITASVNQSGSNVDIDTSRSGRAGRFIGSINSSGDMFVIDPHDGEIWTTYFGPATPIRIVLADFLYTPSPADPNPPLYVVELDNDVCEGVPSSFDDVFCNYWAFEEIERIKDAGITAGCMKKPPLYCPQDTVMRDEMAVFLERGIRGTNYFPPAPTGNLFVDVPANYWAAAWIEQLFNDGITGGCETTRYCPTAPVDRAQMAVFLLKSKYGAAFLPPAPTGMFADVPVSHWAAAWIEQLAKENITGGCGSNKYCPNDNVQRDEMAVFLTRAFGL
ncbi:MAG: S-layer homology domain-containing protein [Gammaproteobacteria bacterium]|nr:S-layer homology domain-containing protein [Gammaproteobacteria bacterium]